MHNYKCKPQRHLEKGRLFPVGQGEREHWFPNKFRVRATGEYRPPRKGEWFLSGSIIEGYKAVGDFATSFDIGELVEVMVVTSYRVVRVAS